MITDEEWIKLHNNMISDDHEFIYLTSIEVDEFIKNTIQNVKELLNQKMNLQLKV
ncbi:hypothetical protein VQL36_07150 [Chengkuizengella sp. SCS-71B]|uniref:hypothetical protein n=1 Tax=Chengkuizengella sp. SCS-71B TaxID=3115290 RepID=UPI0032C20D1F